MSVTVAVGSLVMDRENNKVEIFQLADTTTVSNEQPQQPITAKRLKKVAEFPHEYPPTKIVWEPTPSGKLIATAGECVKIWIVPEEQPP